MANFRDPGIVLYDMLAVLKLWHAFYGIFLWEFFTTLDFEWSVIRGHRPYRRTIWIYSLARIVTLIAIMLDVVVFSVTGPIHCQAFVILEYTFAFISVACVSLLMVLRVYAESHAGNAIWGHNKIVLALRTSLWGTNTAFLIQGTVRLRTVWRPLESICMVLNVDVIKLSVISIFVTSLVLLVMIVIGLLRLRMEGGGMFALGKFLWKQEIIGLSLGVIAGLPPVVFLLLNLNDAFNIMFQIPALIALTIAATQSYRSLMIFSHDTISSSGLPKSGISFAKVKGVPDSNGTIPRGPIHVTIDATHEPEQDSLSQKTIWGPRQHRSFEQPSVEMAQHRGRLGSPVLTV